ncbi:hypothetical protein RJT34_32250 [Clitoria ternatea]|uniref:Uncharacterized protein n=1 Tax=Clitoria ternatea TaxID=43366 RepID=A0AAN9I991_CLITE
MRSVYYTPFWFACSIIHASIDQDVEEYLHKSTFVVEQISRKEKILKEQGYYLLLSSIPKQIIKIHNFNFSFPFNSTSFFFFFHATATSTFSSSQIPLFPPPPHDALLQNPNVSLLPVHFPLRLGFR